MSPEERQRVVDSLPSEFAVSEAQPPEGDPHFEAKTGAKDALQGFFARIGRKVYLACELPVYHPGEKMFAPDVIAVLDADLGQRMSWVVTHEGKGIDLALEVHAAGDRRKDAERNAELYARLGVVEYFIFDRGRLRLTGFRLPAAGAKSYARIVPQGGRYPSEVLGLDLAIEGSRLRFFHGTAALPESPELIAKLETMLDDLEARAAAAEERAADAERRLAEALAEIERLTRR